MEEKNREEQIILGILAGNAKVMKYCFDRIWGGITKITKDAAIAEAITWKGIEKFPVFLAKKQKQLDVVIEKSISNPIGYIYIICRNMAFEYMNAIPNYIDSIEEEKLIEYETSDTDALLKLIRTDIREKIRKTVKSMEEPCRTIIWRHYFESVAFTEIATSLNISYSNTKYHARSCRAILKKMLKKRFPDFGRDYLK